MVSGRYPSTRVQRYAKNHLRLLHLHSDADNVEPVPEHFLYDARRHHPQPAGKNGYMVASSALPFLNPAIVAGFRFTIRSRLIVTITIIDCLKQFAELLINSLKAKYTNHIKYASLH